MNSCVSETPQPSRKCSVKDIELADRLFMQWWQLRIVEQYPTHERPGAWLIFTISMHMQNKLEPF